MTACTRHDIHGIKIFFLFLRSHFISRFVSRRRFTSHLQNARRRAQKPNHNIESRCRPNYAATCTQHALKPDCFYDEEWPFFVRKIYLFHLMLVVNKLSSRCRMSYGQPCE